MFARPGRYRDAGPRGSGGQAVVLEIVAGAGDQGRGVGLNGENALRKHGMPSHMPSLLSLLPKWASLREPGTRYWFLWIFFVPGYDR